MKELKIESVSKNKFCLNKGGKMRKIAIIGSGSWGSALAIYLGKKGENVVIWSFAEDEKEMINKEHKCMFLPNCKIPESVVATNNIEEAIKNLLEKQWKNIKIL